MLNAHLLSTKKYTICVQDDNREIVSSIISQLEAIAYNHVKDTLIIVETSQKALSESINLPERSDLYPIIIDRLIKTELISTFSIILSKKPQTGLGNYRLCEFYQFASKTAEKSLINLRPYLLTYRLTFAVSRENSNASIIERSAGRKIIVEKLWTNGMEGKGNVSVFTIRHRGGTYIADDNGIHHTDEVFDSICMTISEIGNYLVTKQMEKLIKDVPFPNF